MDRPPLQPRDPIELLRRIAQAEEPAEAGVLAAEAARRATATDDASCWLRGADGRLRIAGGPFERPLDELAGIAAEAAGRRGALLRGHRLGCPVAAADGTVVAVLVVTRDPGRDPFTAAETGVLERLAAQVAPYLTSPEESADDPPADDLFRAQAVADLERGDAVPSDPLRLSPFWLRSAYWVLAALGVAALLYGLLGRIDEYAMGPAVVEMAGRLDVLATASGSVASVAVARGDRIERGQALVRLDDSRERRELAGIERELRLQLVARLRDPTDDTARQALFSLRAQRELAAARLAERTVRAAEPGTVADLWAREGHYLEAGQPVLTLATADAEPTLTALVPGHYRPLLTSGLPLRFEIAGYRSVYRRLRVGTVGDEVVGPAEARRYLGPGADAVPIDGAVVLVTAPMLSVTFTADGETHRFHHRMMGTAEIRVRSERILFAAVPALKQVLVDDGA